MQTTNDNRPEPVAPIRSPIGRARAAVADHPMLLFSGLAAMALAALAVGTSETRASADLPAPVQSWTEPVSGPNPSTFPTISGVPLTVADACRGQAWGNENSDCVRAIVREHGDGKPHVRMILGQ